MGREEGSGWGTHVYLWQIHFDIWKNQYNIVKLKKKKECLENICSRQPPKLILLMPKRKMPSTVGPETKTPSSTKANMARKKYMGWCKAGSNRTM